MVIKDQKVLRELAIITQEIRYKKRDILLKYLIKLYVEDALNLCCLIPKGKTWSYNLKL